MLVLALLLGCGPAPAPGGTLVDGLTGLPLATTASGEPLVLRAEPTGGECEPLEVTVAADGTFQLDPPCRRTDYLLRLSDPDRWLDPEQMERGARELSLVAWPVPGTAQGVWKLSGATLTAIEPSATAREEVVLGSAELVRLPDVLPADPPRLVAGEWLVVGGIADAAGALVPLVASEPRRFGDPAAPREVGPWHYLGVRFDDDRTISRIGPQLDPERLVRHERSGHVATWVPADAVEPGLYAIEGEGRRLHVVRFGP